MPFDDQPMNHGGGPEDPRHNPQIMAEIIALSEMQLNMNIERHGVCQLCTRVNLIQHLIKDVLSAAASAEKNGHPDAAALGRRAIAGLIETIQQEMSS